MRDDMWINREAEQELRRWAEHWLADDSQDIDELLDSMHVIDADAEAEAALDVLLTVARTSPYAQTDNLEEFHARVSARLRAARAIHTPEETGTASFEVREEDGVRFWYGAEDGWKDATEVGEDGVIRADAKHFAVGTVLTMCEPLPPRPEPAAKPKETQG